ncbi:MAG: translation initiation factor IF-3 [candidate division WWE3 bacterium]|nr:translation initiation factor IF-3 [candidate division WWE3 bacterium]
MVRYAINQFIKAPEVRVILENGENLGVISRSEALAKAAEMKMDLVELVADITPPVCKIIDYKKFLYAEKQKKKKSIAGTKGRGGELKELRFRPVIGAGDLNSRIDRAHKWLAENNKVKFSLVFEGREFTHPEFGIVKFKDITIALADVGEPDDVVKRDGRNYSVTYSPLKLKK